MAEPLTFTAVFTPDENGWTMAQLAEWPAVVTCGRTVDEACAMLEDAARAMIESYRAEGKERPSALDTSRRSSSTRPLEEPRSRGPITAARL